MTQPVAHSDAAPTPRCLHCGGENVGASAYCCSGCEAAHQLIGNMGLGAYYQRRILDAQQRKPRPEDAQHVGDLGAWVQAVDDSTAELTLMIDGLHCGACVWLIEQYLLQQEGVISARVSLTTRRLHVRWTKDQCRPETLVAGVQALGYRLVPLDPGCLVGKDEAEVKRLLRCLAVAGFAAGNIMLLSVSVWLGADPWTRDLLHWVSALIAIPAVAYAGRPFFASAWSALRVKRTNMDVPISLAVILAPSLSLHETFTGGQHAYFDSAVTLLFFLLIGRYLDHRARRAARATAEQLLALNAEAATVIEVDGSLRDVQPRQLQVGQRVLVVAGARVPADGKILSGSSRMDLQVISGESLPVEASLGTEVFAGTLNIDAPLTILVEKVGESTLLADIIRLMEAAEARRGRFVRIAERVALYYSPVVHLTALTTFLCWVFIGGMAWQQGLLIAIAVLIITCPCALALAVPAVQVVASQGLLKAGILLKSADALERLRQVDHILLDKTGTLTIGRPTLSACSDPQRLAKAAAIASSSRHPLAAALRRAAGLVMKLDNVREVPGQGLEWDGPDGTWRLGSTRFTGQADDGSSVMTLYLRDPSGQATRFEFVDPLRPDAAETIAALRQIGPVEIWSGDRMPTVADCADAVGVTEWHAQQMPADKVRRLEELRAEGKHVLMIGDGINDAPALRAASVSMAPASGAEIAQNAADLVFQGDRLGPLVTAWQTAKAADRLVRQNLIISLIYNLAAVPLAIVGLVTPLIAAVAMSSSSIIVVLNSLRVGRVRPGVGQTPAGQA
ncbi:heavy metal translocating P-type ATPase [Dongia sp.]|uniref:heavy metal translocating P-type ATPase n=1 Tax=Dongia sp. TaxID=1977262 RepID=UPI0035B3137A